MLGICSVHFAGTFKSESALLSNLAEHLIGKRQQVTAFKTICNGNSERHFFMLVEKNVKKWYHQGPAVKEK